MKNQAPGDSMMVSVDVRRHLTSQEPETKPKVSGPAQILSPESWVENYGDILFGFAASRVRDHSIAQDLVQETFLAALKAQAGFAGRSTERAWLFGILRNKLVDYYRLQGRETLFADLESPLPEEETAFFSSG